jgi:hypothetical protein
MPGSCDLRRLHRSRMAVVILYAFVFAASAFFHHDFACHQSSRTHCTSCTVSQSAQKADSHGAPLAALDRVFARVELRASVSADTPALDFRSDRAPPARQPADF